MFGLGKKRSKFGKFLDDNKISQDEISERSGLNRNSVAKAANEDNPKMRGITKKALLEAVRVASGKNVKDSDFWS